MIPLSGGSLLNNPNKNNFNLISDSSGNRPERKKELSCVIGYALLLTIK